MPFSVRIYLFWLFTYFYVDHFIKLFLVDAAVRPHLCIMTIKFFQRSFSLLKESARSLLSFRSHFLFMSSPTGPSRALVLSETAFKKQVDAIQQAHSAFKSVCDVPQLGKAFLKLALNELVDATVCFSPNFIFSPSLIIFQDGLNKYLNFIHHPSFKETLPAIQNTLDDFRSKNPNFELPKNIGRVTGLVARLNDATNATSSRRLPGSAAAAVRFEHAKIRRSRNPVNSLLFI